MIAAYGEQADRVRLLLVSQAAGISQSTWLIETIRSAYTELYGDLDPAEVLAQANLP